MDGPAIGGWVAKMSGVHGSLSDSTDSQWQRSNVSNALGHHRIAHVFQKWMGGRFFHNHRLAGPDHFSDFGIARQVNAQVCQGRGITCRDHRS